MSNSISINYFQRAAKAKKPRIREFYGEVMGWELKEINPNMDIFPFAESSTYGVQYAEDEDAWLDEEHYKKSTWLSIKSDDRAALVRKIKDFGVTELPEHSDQNNYFFQAPGGQVYVV